MINAKHCCLHAALVQWCQNIHMINVRISESFAIVHQHNAFVSRLVVMAIAVLNEKIKNGHIDQVKQTSECDFRL